MEQTLRDLRYAWRRIKANPGFVLVAVLSIALGVGANTSNFTVVNTLLLPDTPYSNPESLVEIYPSKGGEVSFGTLSYPEYQDVAEGSQEVFASVGVGTVSVVQENFEDRSESLMAAIVSGNYFDLVGGEVIKGRPLAPGDDLLPGGHPVAVIGHSFWHKRFAGDPDIVGGTMRLNGLRYTIVGVAKEGTPSIMPSMQPDVWVPAMMVNQVTNSNFDQLKARTYHVFFGKARLKAGATVEQAQAALERVAEDIHRRFPNYDDDWALEAVATTEVGFHPLVDRFVYPLAAMLLIVPALVLLIACVNLASFLLARAADRRREIAVRLALGARRGTLIRQLLTETLVISLLGGALGLLMAHWSFRLLGVLDLPTPVPLQLEMSLDQTALWFTLLVSLLAGLVFGLLPALQSTRAEVAPALKDEPIFKRQKRRFRIRDSLVVGQVALSSLLLIGAGLFLRGLWEAQTSDPGFAHSPTAVTHLRLAKGQYDVDEARRYFREVAREAEALPGVEAVGMTNLLPLSGNNFFTTTVNVAGADPPQGAQGHRIDFIIVDPGFFKAMGIPLVAGESFSEKDGPDADPVLVISKAMARKFWPQADPLGQFVVDPAGTQHRVVGVAADIHVRRLGEAPRPFIYTPLAQNDVLEVRVVAKSHGNPKGVAQRIAELATGLNADVMVVESQSMDEHLALVLVPYRAGGIVLGIFGGLTVLMAAIGLYGIVKYSAAARTREVGLRISLGANRSEVVRMVMSAGMKLVLRGIVIGLLMALAVSWVLSSFLFGVRPFDLLTYVGVALLMLTLSAAASLHPALRASRVDPALALRDET
ncbi:MAG TPA: ABC transporter permease [Acidobacteriota bacterium]|nr:ABC transporter permease [Acidobacteriota bacterium]